jgi:O-antigen ligase
VTAIAVGRRLQTLILAALVIVTLIVTPGINIDPINLPKFLALGIFSFMIFGIVVLHLGREIPRVLKIYLTLSSLFFAWMIFVMLFSGAGVWSQVFGTFGRNTGLITYLSLMVISISVSLVMKDNFESKLLNLLVFLGCLNSTYGILQSVNLDPIDWVTNFGSVFGTLGNPNFFSAFLALSSLASLALGLDASSAFKLRFSALVATVYQLVAVYLSSSTQGLLLFLIGAPIIIFFKFRPKMTKFLVLSAKVGFGGALILGFLGVFQRGPFSALLYQPTVTFRGDYWKAAVSMANENPFFGVGLDSYGDWYRAERSLEAVIRRGADVTTNSAHNVFLDFASNGGWILFAFYVGIILLMFSASRLLLKDMFEFNLKTVAIVVIWACYQVQSIISINQIAIAIWGWVLGGAIIGMAAQDSDKSKNSDKSKSLKTRETLPARVVISSFVGAFLGLIICIWPFSRDIQFKSSIESGLAVRIYNASNQFPPSSYYQVYASGLFLNNRLYPQSIEAAKLALLTNPRDFNAMQLLVKNPDLSLSEKSEIYVKMRKLDPFNTNIEK